MYVLCIMYIDLSKNVKLANNQAVGSHFRHSNWMAWVDEGLPSNEMMYY
jgi:hypothetical protein